jgi:ribosomal protein L37AE/L43A
MQSDPLAEWRRLTGYYHSLIDEELMHLAMQFGELTGAAQQVLRGELHSRGLGDPETINSAPNRGGPSFSGSGFSAPGAGAASRPVGFSVPPRVAAGLSAAERAQPAPDDPAAFREDAGSADEDAGPREYTWKTLLCECEEWKQAWQLGVALGRAGIDNWPESARSTGQLYSRIYVAADQLEQARAIASQPIPQDIVEDSNVEPGEYVLPTCPACGAADPVLESADPANTWRCEVCGSGWTEAGSEPTAEAKGVSFGISGARDGKSRPATGQLYPQGE